MKIGDPIPLALQLTDLEEDQFVLANVFLEGGVEHDDSPVLLAHISNGIYEDDSLIMPNSRWVHIQYRVYSDAGLTLISHFPKAETIFLDQEAQDIENLLTLLTDVDLTAKVEEEDMLKAKLLEDEVLKAVVVPEAEVEEVINIIEGARALVTDALNGSGSDQVAFQAWAYKDNNRVDLADVDDIEGLDDFAGVNVEPVADGEEFQLIRSGRAIGALAGMGCVAGDLIYLSTTPGVLTKVVPVSGTVYIVGQAEPTNPDDIGAANDLFIQPRLVG